jgi:hypothetical protein
MTQGAKEYPTMVAIVFWASLSLNSKWQWFCHRPGRSNHGPRVARNASKVRVYAIFRADTYARSERISVPLSAGELLAKGAVNAKEGELDTIGYTCIEIVGPEGEGITGGASVNGRSLSCKVS